MKRLSRVLLLVGFLSFIAPRIVSAQMLYEVVAFGALGEGTAFVVRGLTSADAMQDLGTFPSGDHSRALAINDRGDGAGTSTSSLGLRTVLWTKAGGMQDLAINAQGSIVALGHVDAGHGHGNHDVPTRVILLAPRS